MKGAKLTFGERIKVAMARAGITTDGRPSAALYNLWNKTYPEDEMTRSNINIWMRAEEPRISVPKLFQLGDMLNCSARWLALETGSMRRASEFDIDEEGLLAAYRSLPPQVQEKVIKDTNFLMQTFSPKSAANPVKRTKT